MKATMSSLEGKFGLVDVRVTYETIRGRAGGGPHMG
jgi:hypothetical protein